MACLLLAADTEQSRKTPADTPDTLQPLHTIPYIAEYTHIVKNPAVRARVYTARAWAVLQPTHAVRAGMVLGLLANRQQQRLFSQNYFACMYLASCYEPSASARQLLYFDGRHAGVNSWNYTA